MGDSYSVPRPKYVAFKFDEPLDDPGTNTSCGEGYVYENGRCVKVDDYSGDGDTDDNDFGTTTCTDNRINIPKTITLNNGTKVSVTFGVTQSDRLNADNKVARSLVNSLIFALNEASKSVQITHVHIPATTNGKHGTYSNHYKKRAFDLSKINNQFIYNIQNSDLVRILQESFDKYPDIRENFGPTFHHKLGKNHNVGGHKDHFHISINNCN